MQEMTVTRNVYRARKAYWRAMHTTNIVYWQRENPDTWRIVAECMRLKREAKHGTG